MSATDQAPSAAALTDAEGYTLQTWFNTVTAHARTPAGIGGRRFDDLERIVERILADRLAALPTPERLAERLAAYLDQAEQGMNAWGTCSHEWLSLTELRALLDAPVTDDLAAKVQPDPSSEYARGVRETSSAIKVHLRLAGFVDAANSVAAAETPGAAEADLAAKVEALADEATGDRESALRNRYDTPSHHARWNTAENFRALLPTAAPEEAADRD